MSKQTSAVETQEKGCPCCGVSQKKHAKDTGDDRAGNIVQCAKCKAIFTRGNSAIYLGESYAIVLPRFTTDVSADAHSIYFDFMVLGSKGLERRHGWFDPRTKLITQVG